MINKFKTFWKRLNKTQVDDIIAFEAGELSESRTIKLFQELVDSGQAWHLQGMYGRMADDLLRAGKIKPPRNRSGRDYYGNELRPYYESLESGKKKKSVDKSEISLERTEEKIYDEQEKWIRSKFGAKAAETANYGWGVNVGDRDVTVSTKVYGHGVITSKGDSKGNIKHSFETF